jgi:hypothetical protein
VQQNDGSTTGRAGFGIADIEDPGIDLLERSERSVRSTLDRRQTRRFRLRRRRARQTELGDGGAERRGAEQAAAVMVDLFGTIDLGHGKSPCMISLYGSIARLLAGIGAIQIFEAERTDRHDLFSQQSPIRAGGH